MKISAAPQQLDVFELLLHDNDNAAHIFDDGTLADMLNAELWRICDGMGSPIVELVTPAETGLDRWCVRPNIDCDGPPIVERYYSVAELRDEISHRVVEALDRLNKLEFTLKLRKDS